jgi:hypothetical protein
VSEQLAIPEIADIKTMPLEQVIDQVYPAALAALEQVDTTEGANEIRARIEAVVGYVNRKLPAVIGDRKKALKKANKGNQLYLESARRAGGYWAAALKHAGRPPRKSVAGMTVLTAEQAGFVSRQEANRCVKASKVHEQDVMTYFQECDAGGRQYTLTGLVHVYDLLHPSGAGEDVDFSKRPLAHFLRSTAEKIERRMEDAEGDVEALMKRAAQSLRDAEEIMVEIEAEP